MSEVVLLISPEFWQHGFGPNHPLKPERLQRTFELLQEYGLLYIPSVQLVTPRKACEDELLFFHDEEYIAAVKDLSNGDFSVPSSRYGFGPGDNPVFAGMFDSARLKVGSALLGAEMLVNDVCDIAFSYAGGMHHAGANFASGFCIFNDAAVAIHWLIQQGLRVAYVDIDVHHGDGVQAAFYDSDAVLTISLHQDGRSLFPGTGFVEEIGHGAGKGYSVNVPLPAYTFDETYLWAFEQIVPPMLSRFGADIMVTQLGVDTHYLDPLANLMLTTSGQLALFKALRELAPKWLALGGGGYNLDVVPRAWTLAFSVMTRQSLPDELPPRFRKRYGGQYLHDHDVPCFEQHIGDKVWENVREIVARVEQIHDK